MLYNSDLLYCIENLNIPTVRAIEAFPSLDSLLQYTLKQTGIEGFVVAFASGDKVKIKTEEYVRIHRALDTLRFDRNIVALIINEELDDSLALLNETEVCRIREFERRFWSAFTETEARLLSIRDTFYRYNHDRKRIALELVPMLNNKCDAQFVFRMLDSPSIRDLLLQHIGKNITTNVKWEECAKWMGM